MEKENWKPIKDFEGYYEISSFGRVKSLNRVIETSDGINKKIKERILKSSENSNGYLIVTLKKNNKRKQFKVHRLVAEAFIPNPESKPYIDHINTIRTDNRVSNLRWVTQKENCNNELSKKNYSEAQKGHEVSEETKKKIGKVHKGRKHTEETKKKLKGHEVSEETRKKIGKGNGKLAYCIELDKIFESTCEASRELGICQNSISLACRGKRETAGGYHWEYVNNK